MFLCSVLQLFSCSVVSGWHWLWLNFFLNNFMVFLVLCVVQHQFDEYYQIYYCSLNVFHPPNISRATTTRQSWVNRIYYGGLHVANTVAGWYFSQYSYLSTSHWNGEQFMILPLIQNTLDYASVSTYNRFIINIWLVLQVYILLHSTLCVYDLCGTQFVFT